jgi:hypothetical protein
VFNFKELEISKSFTHPSRLFEIQDNGTYLVGGFVTKTQKFHLIIYDPIKKTKSREVIFDKRIDELFTFKNKIVFSIRTENYGNSYMLKIMDENLNLIREKETNSLLKCVDQSHLYCIFSRTRLVMFNWYLNEIKTNVIFQYEDPKQNFYFKHAYYCEMISTKINQFFKRDNKYILNYKSGDYEPDELCIFSELGALLQKKVILDEFVIDSKNNIIVNNKKK